MSWAAVASDSWGYHFDWDHEPERCSGSKHKNDGLEAPLAFHPHGAGAPPVAAADELPDNAVLRCSERQGLSHSELRRWLWALALGTRHVQASPDQEGAGETAPR